MLRLDRERLTSWARIVLLAADGLPNTAIAGKVTVTCQTVIGCGEAMRAAAISELHNVTRSGLPDSSIIVRSWPPTREPPPTKLGVTHWSSRMLTDHLAIGNATVARA
jgi:hypothetical protein